VHSLTYDSYILKKIGMTLDSIKKISISLLSNWIARTSFKLGWRTLKMPCIPLHVRNTYFLREMIHLLSYPSLILPLFKITIKFLSPCYLTYRSHISNCDVISHIDPTYPIVILKSWRIRKEEDNV